MAEMSVFAAGALFGIGVYVVGLAIIEWLVDVNTHYSRERLTADASATPENADPTTKGTDHA